MAYNPIDHIRTKTREQWQRLLTKRLTDVRIWVQEHGEIALLLGLIVGVSFVLLFKPLVVLAVVLVLLGFMVWCIALPEMEVSVPPPPVSDDNIEPDCQSSVDDSSSDGNS